MHGCHVVKVREQVPCAGLAVHSAVGGDEPVAGGNDSGADVAGFAVNPALHAWVVGTEVIDVDASGRHAVDDVEPTHAV